MAKKIVRRKKKRALRGITRLEAQERFGLTRITMERLAADGTLVPIGTRGRELISAHIYDPAEIRRLTRVNGATGGIDEDVLVQDYYSHTCDFHDRTERLCETFREVSRARELWTRLVEAVTRITASWPRRIATIAAAVPREDAALLAWADDPKPTPPRPRRYLRPEELLPLLDGDPRWPWKPAAAPGIRRRAEQGLGIELLDNGGWYEWDPAGGIPEPIRTHPPVIRPLLEEIDRALTGSDQEIWDYLGEHERRPAPQRPKTLRAARELWRKARSEYRETRVHVRRGHVRRAEFRRELETAVVEFWQFWRGHWSRRALSVAGDYAAALSFAEDIRAQLLQRLARAAGEDEARLLPVRKKKAPRKRKAKNPSKRRSK